MFIVTNKSPFPHLRAYDCFISAFNFESHWSYAALTGHESTDAFFTWLLIRPYTRKSPKNDLENLCRFRSLETSSLPLASFSFEAAYFEFQYEHNLLPGLHSAFPDCSQSFLRDDLLFKMNLLHRVLYGRVAKQRPAPTDRHEGDRPKAYSGSTTQFRQVQSSSPRASSTITGLNTAGDPSAKNGQSSQVGDASTTRMPIKEEDDNDKLDPVSMFSAQGDHVDILAEIGRPEGHIAKSEGLSIDASLISPVKRESTKEGSFERHANEEAFLEENSKDANEGQSREDDTAEELYATGIHYFNSDEPIPSIEEEDGDVGEMEQSRKRRNTPPFLHGMTHRLDRTSESILEDGLAEGMEDEDFEEELGGEVEENLLIDEKDLRYWLHHKHSTAGIQGWPSEACRLYKLLFLRGLYPIFGSQWTWNFLDHPMPGELFTPLGSDDKCLLKAEKSDYHGRWTPPK